jgi:DNA-binding MarR family transcriptional regulator
MSHKQSRAERGRLAEATLEELTRIDPGGMVRAIRRWSHGRLSLVHLHVLMLLRDDGIAMRAIADALDVSQASATGIVDRMEERGLVVRKRDANDRRVVNVSLTPAGQAVIAGIATERREGLAKLLEELSDDELAALLHGSQALRRAREQLLPGPDEEHHRDPAQ